MRSSIFLAVCLAAVPVEAADPSLEERVKALESRLASLDKGPSRSSAFNPSIGMALDFAARADNSKANHIFRAGEVNLEAAVDPYARGWAIINGNQGGVEVEEAVLQTTGLK